MKKLIAIILTLVVSMSLVACGGNKESAETNTSDAGNGSLTETTVSESESVTDGQTEEMESTNVSNVEATEVKVLVAYFSATGTTKRVAERIADGLNADLYEIVPQQPYTDADLNYRDNNSRSTIEMNNPDARPEISGSVENMDQYDIVFLGYPIWWYDAPRIMSTFVESYDFSGKTIVPFCTSGGSSIGSSASNLEKLTSGVIWLAGNRLSGSDSQDTVMEWVNSLGLDFGA